MKTLLLASLLSSSAFGAEYTCRAGMVKLDLTLDEMMTTLTVRDAQMGDFYYNGVVSDVIDRNGRTDLMFETHSHKFLQLQFKSSAIKAEDETLFGFIRGWHGAGFIDDTLKCLKKTI